MARRALPFLLLTACPRPGPGQACPFEVDAWFDSPARHVAHAAEDGDFDYVAPSDELLSVAGSWDSMFGDFDAEIAYVDGYFLVSELAVGRGALEADGDYAFAWSWESTDALGVVRGATVDEERCGCEMVRRSEPWDGAERDLVEENATIQDAHSVVVQSASEASEYHVTTLHRSDGSRRSSYEGKDGESWYEVLEPGDGTRSASFHLRYQGGVEDGGYERDLRGTRAYTFDRRPDEGDWTVLHLWWLQHYDGSGLGEVAGEGVDGTLLTCWYRWEADGQGSYECDDGSSGPY